MADPERLHAVIAAAGFRNIGLEEQEIDVIEVDSGQTYWECISDLAAPVMTLVNQLDDETRQAYINDVVQTADALKQGSTLTMRGTTWLASAEK